MKNLSRFSPAETLFALQGKKASIKEILKLTFMDLILKQVLRTFEDQIQANNRDKIRVLKYVAIGNNFYTYQPLAHENIFLAPFLENDSVRILFRHMVKIGYQNASSESKIHNTLLESPRLNEYFSRNFFQKIFGGFSLTSMGLELRHTLESEITQLEDQLPELISSNHQKALEILKAIKGNIFLLSNIEFDLLNIIDKELLAELNKTKNINSDLGCSGYAWISFDSYSENFDSSCSGDSGCSGGGCSGCGGGGCGGCGGCS